MFSLVASGFRLLDYYYQILSLKVDLNKIRCVCSVLFQWFQYWCRDSPSSFIFMLITSLTIQKKKTVQTFKLRQMEYLFQHQLLILGGILNNASFTS